MIDVVELADGSRLPLASLPVRVPHTFFMHALHVDICDRLAARRDFADDARAVYVNLLCTKSHRAKQITALVRLIESGRINPRRVFSRFIGPEFADLLGSQVRIELREPRAKRLIDRGQSTRFVGKTVSHRLFRLLGHLPKDCESVIRGWVDTTDATYPELIDHAVLLIYPFAGSMRRQWRYIRKCRTERRTMHLMGVPYRLRDCLRMINISGDFDRVLVESEMRCCQVHARELLDHGLRELFTTDEFAAASRELHRHLIAGGAKTTNSAHGVAVYGPHVVCSHFRFFNSQQRKYYEHFGSFASYDFRTPVPTNGASEKSTDFKPTVVFILGNWRQSGKKYEARFESDALDAAVRSARANDLTIKIKAHPNVSARECMRIARQYGVAFLSRLHDETITHPVYVNTVSSSYYECLNYGPTVFLHDGMLRPGDVFGDHLESIEMSELQSTLANFLDAQYWRKTYEQQLEREHTAHAAGGELQSTRAHVV